MNPDEQIEQQAATEQGDLALATERVLVPDFCITYVGKEDDDDNVLHIESRTLRGGTTMGEPLALNKGETAEIEIEGGGITLIITEKSRTTVMDAPTEPAEQTEATE